MKNYYGLLEEKRNINREIGKEKRKLHKRYYAANKTAFLILDVLVVLAILSTFTAAMLTKMHVVYENPEVEFVEANPVAAEEYGLKAHPEGGKWVKMFVYFTIFTLFITYAYIYYRRNTISEEGFVILATIVVVMFLVHGWDAMNNIGVHLGRMLFGG